MLFTGFLLVNLGKLGVDGTEHFGESGPKMETSGRDLDFGGNVAGRERKI